MVTLLLVETDPKIEPLIHEVENMAHAVGMNVFIQHEGDDIDEILDLIDSPIVAFTPNGELTLEEMVKKYDANMLLVIGGFTEEREFDSAILSRADATVSLGEEYLPIPEVVEKIIDAYKR
jgi:rRNA pseudouridine-1189 N-methylase Emg1 (Nep1/Mra1 family)